MKKLLGIVLVALGLFGTAGVRADPIGGSSCGSCWGTTVTLEFEVVTATNWLIHLFINTTGYNGPGGANDFITGVSIKPASADTLGSNNSTTAVGTWNFQTGGLANANCNGSGAGFLCADTASLLNVTDGTTYEWIFDVSVANASDWFTAPGAASIKANFGPSNGIIISEPITLQECPTPVCTPQEIPEPGILSLLGIALIGMGVPVMRRRKAQR